MNSREFKSCPLHIMKRYEYRYEYSLVIRENERKMNNFTEVNLGSFIAAIIKYHGVGGLEIYFLWKAKKSKMKVWCLLGL